MGHPTKQISKESGHRKGTLPRLKMCKNLSCLPPPDQHWSDDIPSDAETELRLQCQAKVKAELELRVSESEEEKPPDTPKQEERGRGQEE